MASSPLPTKENEVEDIQLPLELLNLSTHLEKKPEALATGDEELQIAALKAAKHVFDMALKTESKSRPQLMELLKSMSPSEAPKTRSQTAAVETATSNGKRKRSGSPSSEVNPSPNLPTLEDTPLPELCIEGMDEDQLWTQLDLRGKAVCDILEFALETTGEVDESDEEGVDDLKSKKRKMMLDGDEDSEDDSFDEEEDLEEDSEDDEDSSDDDEDEKDEEGLEDEDGDVENHLGDSTTELRDTSDSENELDLDGVLPSALKRGKRKSKPGRKAGGHPELDDGFFDLAAFNAETEQAEARASSKGRLGRGDDDDEEDDEEDEGVDYFAPVDDDAEAEDGELFYKDFFEPPSKAAKQKPKSPGQVRFHQEVLVRNIKPKGKGLPVNAQFSITEEEDDEDDDEFEGEDSLLNDEEGLSNDEDLEGSIEEDDDEDQSGSEFDSEEDEDEDGFQSRETIDRLKDDLFADDDDEESDSGLTTHQKRLASLQDEISQLETENVSKKHWTLMGEATSRSRPQNALLEEDLEFERVMKSVPVITEETVQGLEERIKARILEGRFDDVVRRRPVDDKPFLPSRFFELQDTKSKQSLAEIYEDEYTAAQTGGIVGEDRDGKLAKEHKEIEKLWEGICHKLDALTNAHFTPKAPKATISTVSNISAASMESALPTTMATSTMLAPEEVFTPSANDLVARSELTPTQKRALHNKQKKAKRKARDSLEKSVDKFAKMKGIKGVKLQKDAALKSLVKSGKGVTVIGKKGQESGKKVKRKSD